MDKLTLDDLHEMMADLLVIGQPGVHTDEEYQKAAALRRNQVRIARQLLDILAARPPAESIISTGELVELLRWHETYWSNPRGRGDVEAENANMLSTRIVEIAQNLIDALKNAGSVNDQP